MPNNSFPPDRHFAALRTDKVKNSLCFVKFMNKIFFFIIPLSIIASWFIFDLSRYLPPDIIFQKGIKYESKDVQNRLAKELQDRNIPHRIRNDGIIDYRKKDDKKVKKIADKIYAETSGTSVDSRHWGRTKLII